MSATHLSLRLALSAALAIALQVGSLTRCSADTLLSGFNGDLSSSIGIDWHLSEPTWSSQFVPQLSEGTGALLLSHNPSWQAGLKLAGGEALAQLIVSSDTLEFDAIGAYGMAWRQVFAVLNGNDEHVAWQQTPEFPVSVPSETTPFNHIVIDLTDVNGAAEGGANWKTLAQAWLDAPEGQTKTYLELLIGVNGDTNPATADFNFDTAVDGQDFLIWQRNVGNMEAGPEQGDTNFDFLVDGVDLNTWSGEFGRPTRTTIDNIVFGTNAVTAIPEPSAVVMGLTAALLMSTFRRRRDS
jgi:hypothetical protein